MQTAFVGGHRWSTGTGRVRNRSVVVADGRIVGIDTDPGDAEVVDVGSGLLVPGFVDAHVHPVKGGLRILSCDLTEVSNREEAEARIAGVAGSLPSGQWLTGGGWLYDWYPSGCPSSEVLDRLVPEHPAVLEVRDGHSNWANSLALSLAGITAATPDPPDGRIERNADGSPQGTLHEGAMRLVRSLVPPPSSDRLSAALGAGIDYLVSRGVTSWQDAWVGTDEEVAYSGVNPDFDVVGALWWDRARGPEQVPDIVERSRTVGGLRPRAVKLMLDGVCENFTASLNAPYHHPHGGVDGHSGIDFIEPGLLARAVIDLDRLGFQCHFHAIGDRAVRSALDAVEAARRTNGWGGPLHHVAHLQIVDPLDVPRFAAWGVAANCQPLWACNEPAMTELTIPFLGAERAEWQYPFGSLRRSGALVAMGSDWPVSTGDVMTQISVATRRRPPGDDLPPVLGPAERLTLHQALSGFTAGSARLNGTAHRTGSIRIGNVADLVMLERDPFLVDDPVGIRVQATMAGGRFVFDRKDEA